MDWATRAYHESQMHKQSCCFTATYAPEHLPPGGLLTTKHSRSFLKSLRRHFDHQPIRALIVGEYGEKTRRAHLHGLIYGSDALGGAVHLAQDKSGHSQYENEVITRCWNRGVIRLDSITPASCAYIAGYCLKKISEEARIMSYPRQPALGRTWFDTYRDQLKRLGHVVIDGNKRPIPRAYFEWAEGELDHWKEASANFAIELQKQFTPAEITRRAVAKELNLTAKVASGKKSI